MPELPEVEITRRNLVRWLDGRRIVSAHAGHTRTFRGAERKVFERIRGHLEDAQRKGKYLLLTFEGGVGALAHLGMTGKWVRRPKDHPEPYSRARFDLDDGSALHFRDPRMFGRIEPVPADALWSLPPIRALGLDPLTGEFNWRTLKEAVARSRQPLKVALMDQGRVAGLGNIHAAEALFRAHLHPQRLPGSLSDAEWKALARGILATIRFALENEDADELEYVEEPGSENPFLIYGRAGEPCARCRRSGRRSTVHKITQAGRTTYFCPVCQPLRRPGNRGQRFALTR